MSILFSQAVKNFKKYLKVERSYSSLTIKEYLNDLDMLYRYLKENLDYDDDFFVNDIEIYEIAEFLSDIILEKNNKAITRNRKLYSIRSFFKFLVKYDYVNDNPTLKIESSKTEIRSEPIYLKLKEARKFINIIQKKNNINKFRDLAIVKVFLYAGLRVSELANLNLKDIDYTYKFIKFYGKGNKERIIPLHNDIINSIQNYLPERKKIKPKYEDARNALFLSRHGNRINVRTVQKMVKKYAREAGLKEAKNITPHKLRHTFASILYQKTKDIKVVQELLGHSNISTTQIYTHTDIEQKKDAINEMPDL